MDATPTSNAPSGIYDPLTNATQAAFRQFTGVHGTSGNEVTLRAWVIAFQQHPHSRARYRRIARMLSNVDGQARAPVLLTGIDYTHYSAFPERTDLGGEFTLVGIATSDRQAPGRGSVLVQLNGVMVLIYSISELPFPERPHAGDILEKAVVERRTN